MGLSDPHTVQHWCGRVSDLTGVHEVTSPFLNAVAFERDLTLARNAESQYPVAQPSRCRRTLANAGEGHKQWVEQDPLNKQA